MKQTDLKNGLVRLTADPGHAINETGTMHYFGDITVRPERVDAYTEVTDEEREAALVEADRQKRYPERVEELIRQRYTPGQEHAIQRQRDRKPEEFEAYDTHAEQCKATARAEIFNS